MEDSPISKSAPAAAPWLAGGGELGKLIRTLDWQALQVGAPESWPQSLRSAVSICIGSRFPVVLYWGPRRVVLYNDAYAEILGSKHPGALGRPGQEVWSEIWDAIAPMLDDVAATGVATWSEDQLLRLERRGYPQECYFSFSFSPVRGDDGRVEGIFTAMIENKGRQIAKEREALLASEQAAKHEALTANRAKDEFLAMLSHELRNPLAPIATALQLMRLRGADVPELGTLERQTAHLRRLVDDLLDVSRITRGKIELRKRNVEIGDAVLRAMELASPLLEPRAHRVSIEGVPRRGLLVHGDSERLAQVVFNLLSNAAKYSEVRSSIVVRAWRDNDRVRLSVKDEGSGIAPEMIDRVFDMFVQQGQTLERSQGGLGLGLTIVRSLVEAHGGRVTVQSAGLGHGSQFMIDLPGAPVVLPLTRSAERPPARPAGGLAQRFLVVDDNVDAAIALAQLLRLLGQEVEVAHDGLRALAAARRFLPDVALIDIGLPVMDGFELAGRLRDQHPDLRLVAVTGYGLERDRERSAEAGFSGHLVKPVELVMLERLLVDSRPPLPNSGTEQPSL